MSNSSNYRRRTQRKSMITTVIAGIVIIAAVIAIIVVILSLIKNASSDKKTSATEPAAATAQPTLYIPTEQGGLTPSEIPTQVPGTTQPGTPQPTSPAQPTQPSATEAPQTPTEAPQSPTDAPAQPQPSSDGSYTDEDGVLHVFTPSGYNWTYLYDPEYVTIKGSYRGDLDMFEFFITGLKSGHTDFNLYYYTAEDKSTYEKVSVNAEIDGSLRVVRVD